MKLVLIRQNFPKVGSNAIVHVLVGTRPIKPREFMVLLLSWSFQHVASNI
jgi:hypothetical protein